MTGYARAEGARDGVSWVWEAKSVNGRGLDVRVRLPQGFDYMELPVREATAKVLKRGNVQISLVVNSDLEAASVAINQHLLDQVLALCAQVQQSHPHIAPPTWDGLLQLRGILDGSGAVQSQSHDDLEPALRASFETALAALADMRKIEGGRIGAVLNAQLTEVAALTGRAEQSAAARPEAIRERLRTQVNAILEAGAGISEERLTQEVALLAVKADIREELDRLTSHVGAAVDLLKSGDAVGRKLDFLAQEFNREANTLCSKSQDVDLTRIGLELKVIIDQFREQVQNIE